MRLEFARAYEYTRRSTAIFKVDEKKCLRKSARYSDTSKDPILKNTRSLGPIHLGMAYTQLNVNNLIIAFKLVRNTNIRDHCASINLNRF